MVSRAVIRDPAGTGRVVVTASSTASQARFGVQASSAIAVRGTASSQTLCQMPVVREYQMLWGSGCQSCLPRG